MNLKLLIKTEFKRNLKSLILWTSIIAGLSFIMLSLFPAFESSMADLESMLASFPEAFLDAFGLGENGLDLSSAYGWYGMEGYLFVVLIGGSYAAILGSSMLAKEEDDKTIEFLLSKPISRKHVLLGKTIVVIINLFILNFILFLSNLLGFLIVADIEWVTLILLMVGPFFLQVIFASMAMAISVFATKSRAVMSISLGLVIGLYFLDVIATVTDKLNFLKYFTLYEYVNAIDLIDKHRIEPLYLILSLAFIALSTFITWFFYTRKDIVL